MVRAWVRNRGENSPRGTVFGGDCPTLAVWHAINVA